MELFDRMIKKEIVFVISDLLDLELSFIFNQLDLNWKNGESVPQFKPYSLFLSNNLLSLQDEKSTTIDNCFVFIMR